MRRREGFMENIKNNVVFKAFLLFMIGVLLFALMPVNVYATNQKDDEALYIDGHKILSIYYGETERNARMYAEPNPFTFSSEMNGTTRYFDGDYMALEASATSTAGVIPIHIDMYVYNTETHHDCTIWSNGNLNKFDWISLGSGGGSFSDNYYYVDSAYTGYQHTVQIKTYSWI